MDEIRKNNENEDILLNIKFQVPIILHIIMGLFILIFIIFAIVLYSPYFYEDTIMFCILSVVLIILYIAICLGVRLNECIVTNKVVKGRQFIIFGYKKFSYRLDSISDIQSSNILGLNCIKLTFNQGYINVSGKNKPFRIVNVAQYDTVIEKLNKILENVKNDKDVEVSLSLKQTEALNNIASSIGNKKEDNFQSNNASNSIRQLKTLLDDGLITQEEYEKKRKDLLEHL